MTVTFDIPNTPTVRVEYLNGGTRYATVIPNPVSKDGLVIALLAKNLGISSVVAIKPIQPTVPIQRTYAQHRAVQYMAAMERR